jgi:hypothetical protein
MAEYPTEVLHTLLLTVAGTVGGLCFAGWAGADRLWSVSHRAALRRAAARASRLR